MQQQALDIFSKPNIQLWQGDCLELMPDIEDGSVDMVFTDPPYTTPVITSFGRKRVKNYADFSIQETYLRCLKKEFERILKSNGRLFLFCDDKYYPQIFKVFFDWHMTQLIVWDKEKIGMGRPFRKRHELLFYANRESFNYNRTEKTTHFPTVLRYKPVGQKRLHGAQKPIELVSDIIVGFSNELDLIVDPFIGSGTTGLACKNLNRNFIGIEKDEKYFEIAKNRIGG